MSTTRYATLLGLALGAVWGVAGFPAALLSGVLAALGYVVALVLEGQISVNAGDVLGRNDRSNQL